MSVLYSCGKCCHEKLPCDKCLEDTLNANGLDLSLIDELKGLEQHNDSYSGHYRSQYSALSLKVNRLLCNKRSRKIIEEQKRAAE